MPAKNYPQSHTSRESIDYLCEMIGCAFFTENMKLAELVVANFRLLDLLPCFGMGLGMEEGTVRQICEQKGVDTELFLVVCNVYTFDDYYPDTQTLDAVDPCGLLDVMEASHREYREVQMPRIFDTIRELAPDCPEPHSEVLVRFCNRYEQEILSHFAHEENEVFPRIREALERGGTPDKDLMRHESATNELNSALDDLQSIIIKYMPARMETLRMFRRVMVDLALFDIDTDRHILLEDILMAKLARMEGAAK